MKKALLALCSVMTVGTAFANETPLCQLPLATSQAKAGANDSGCNQLIAAAKVMNKTGLALTNTMAIPAQLSVGAVYLQAITMAPRGIMLPVSKSDIHLEMDIHAKANLKSRGFAPGDWIPNLYVTYKMQKLGTNKVVACGMKMHDKDNKGGCVLMPMVASDGPHYGDNVKLDGPGIYLVTITAHTQPMLFGWHTDTDSKVLGTEYVDWKFKQNYLLKWTGVGKKGGY